METKIAMAGLAHGHGIGFLSAALKLNGVSVTGFYDNVNKESAQEASVKFNAPVYDSLDDLIYSSGANTLITAAINSDKADIIVKAIDAGINIISDKPRVTTVDDLHRVTDALERNKQVKLYLMLSERYNPVVVTAKKLIDAGEIGSVVGIINMRPHRLRPQGRPDWMFNSRQYGGIINDIGVHDIDIAVWLANSDVDEILAASVSNKRFTDIHDFNDNRIKSVVSIIWQPVTVLTFDENLTLLNTIYSPHYQTAFATSSGDGTYYLTTGVAPELNPYTPQNQIILTKKFSMQD